MPLPLSVLGSWRQAYASWQPIVTRLSARLPVASLDLAILALGATILGLLWARRGSVRVVPVAAAIVVAVAAVWLLFLVLWGWHYQVPTIERRLAVAQGEVTRERGEAFARAMVAQANALHGEAHASGWPMRAELPATLAPRLARVLPMVGVSWMPGLPVPRHTMLDWYFRAGGIDGMTNPFGLEVVVNSRVLPVELPALIAHEYAHLAGFADEADASVVAWLACQDGPASVRYSGALAVLPHLLSGLPREVQRAVIAEVGEGPRADLRAVAARLADQRPWVHAFAWQTYDRFLRANRVTEGVARYDAVARVLIAAADPATGRLRRSLEPWPSPH